MNAVLAAESGPILTLKIDKLAEQLRLGSAPAPQSGGERLTILYGSQTGQAEPRLSDLQQQRRYARYGVSPPHQPNPNGKRKLP